MKGIVAGDCFATDYVSIYYVHILDDILSKHNNVYVNIHIDDVLFFAAGPPGHVLNDLTEAVAEFQLASELDLKADIAVAKTAVIATLIL